MRILTLPIEKQWFDLIAQGVKLEEYRAISPHWVARLILFNEPHSFQKRTVIHSFCLHGVCAIDPNRPPLFDTIMRDFRCEPKPFDAVRFVNGYAKTSPSLLVEWKGVDIGVGRKAWGAPENNVFRIKLGNILNLTAK
jgi:hypothetical protein